MNKREKSNGVSWLVMASRSFLNRCPSAIDRASLAEGQTIWVGFGPSEAMTLRAYSSSPILVVIEMRDRERTRTRVRVNEPSVIREIPGTDYDLLIYEGRDLKTGKPYYHWRLARTDGERYFSTSRPLHLLQMVQALQFAAIGFSRIEGEGIDVMLREKLAALALALQAVSLSGDDGSEQKVNGLGDAFGAAA